jgi:hypothetical protein
LSHRVVVKRGLDRVIGMGEPGDLFTIHRRSLTAPETARTSISSADWTPVRQSPIHGIDNYSRRHRTKAQKCSELKRAQRSTAPG